MRHLAVSGTTSLCPWTTESALRGCLSQRSQRWEACKQEGIRRSCLHGGGRGAIGFSPSGFSSSQRLWRGGCGAGWRRRRREFHSVVAFGREENDNGDSVWDPSLEIGIPADQRPVNELAALKEVPLYSWAQLTLPEFGGRLLGLWSIFFLALGGPIAAASFDPSKETLQFVLAGGGGALFGVAIIVLRMYLGWSYVGDRLLSAVVPYEETGWYDGQLWVKPPEVLARDRLLGSYQVKPVMDRLRQTLLGAGSLLAASTVALIVLGQSGPDTSAGYLATRGGAVARAEEAGVAASDSTKRKLSFRLQDLLNLPAEVADDDDVAAAAAEAANGRPVYCTDRYYRALAGGQYCKWEDLRK